MDDLDSQYDLKAPWVNTVLGSWKRNKDSGEFAHPPQRENGVISKLRQAMIRSFKVGRNYLTPMRLCCFANSNVCLSQLLFAHSFPDTALPPPPSR